MELNDTEINPVSPEALATLVAALYELTGPVACDWLSSGLNDVFVVTTGREAAILKIYRAGWRTQAEVLEELAALQHLDRKGVRVALPIARRDGALVGRVASPAGERPVVLFARAEGKVSHSPDETGWRRYGQILAEVHNATDDLAGAPLRYDLDHLLARPLREMETFLEDRPGDRDFVRGVAGRLRERIEGLPLRTLDWGYCHGDFRAANLTRDEATGAVTAFDFELGGTGFRAYDLAYTQTTLHRMAVESLWRAPALADHDACWTSFLSGYADRRPLGATDREAIPLFVAMRPIHLMGALLQTARESRGGETWPQSVAGGLPGGDLFDRALQFLRAWNEAYL